jgi:hypothetical protein
MALGEGYAAHQKSEVYFWGILFEICFLTEISKDCCRKAVDKALRIDL